MKKQHFAPYRIWRTTRAVVSALARYQWLALRGWLGGAPSDAAWLRAHDRTAAAIHDLAVDLGGLFVKGAQVAGARADFLPEPFIRRLGRFHDRVPARSFASLRPGLESELGRPLDGIFASIDPEPLASASLAQVHRAKLADGAEVAVKIQYPEARRLFRVDLSSLRRSARWVSWVQPGLRLHELVDELTDFVALELDFAREADTTERIGKAFSGDAEVRVPRVVRECSTARVLVLEFLDGTRITDTEALRARGVDLAEVCGRVARVFVRMIFEHEFFHGDPHPGNLLVMEDGAIGLLDFGLAKELPAGFGAGVAALLVCGAAGDAAGAEQAADRIGLELAPGGAAWLPRLATAMLGRIGDASEMKAYLQESPVRRVPSHLTLVLRVLILLNGLSHTLAPGRFLVQQELLRALGPLVQAQREPEVRRVPLA